MVKVPVYPQMSTGLLVMSTGKSAPPCCRLEAGMPRNHSYKGPALALSAAFLGGLLMSDVDPLLHFRVTRGGRGRRESRDTEEAGVAMC